MIGRHLKRVNLPLSQNRFFQVDLCIGKKLWLGKNLLLKTLFLVVFRKLKVFSEENIPGYTILKFSIHFLFIFRQKNELKKIPKNKI